MLWGLCLLYFGLSFLMKWFVDRLPLFCANFWPLIAVWGITWTVIGYGIVVPYMSEVETFWGHVWRLALVFLSALPGQYLTYHNQLKRIVKIFRDFDINKKTTGDTIYLHELDYYKELFGESDYESANKTDLVFHCNPDDLIYYYFDDTASRKHPKRTRNRYYH